MGNKRKSIGNKLRFEVFKRDSFTCKWCGKSSPDVVLNIDHIEPVSKGGTNDILNLITSCFECNSGKSNRLLGDDTVVVKQKGQLDLLQEKRNQMMLMYEWKKGLSEVDNESRDLVVDYIQSKCPSINISIEGLGYLSQLIKKFDFSSILESIDISADKYLKFDGQDGYTDESCNVFISKIGGIIVNKNKSPINQKISYLIGICRNKFSWINDKLAYTLLTTYVNRLKANELSDEEIFELLDTEIQPKTIELRNWTQWKQFFETQISQIEEQSNLGYEIDNNSYEVTEELLDSIIDDLTLKREDVILGINQIGKGVNGFHKEELVSRIDWFLISFLDSIRDDYNNEEVEGNDFYIDSGPFFKEAFDWFDISRSKVDKALYKVTIYLVDHWIQPVHDLGDGYNIKGEHFKYIVDGYNSYVKTQGVTEEMKEQNFYVSNDVTEELLDSTFDKFISLRPYVILGIEHISQGFDGFNKDELIKDIDRIVLNYLNAMTEFLLESGEMDEPILEVQLSDFHWSILDKETIFYEVIEVTILDIFSRWWREGSLFELESGDYKVEDSHYDYLEKKYHRLVVMSEEPN